MNGEPVALRVFQAVGNVIERCRLVRSYHAIFLGLYGKRYTHVGHVSNGCGFFSHQLRQRLA